MERAVRFVLVLLFCAMPAIAQAQDNVVRLHAPDSLSETGLLAYILPRFSLKTQVKVELVPADQADVLLGSEGRALFEGAGQVWRLELRNPDHPAVGKLATWLTSEVGKRTVTGFTPDGAALFAPPSDAAPAIVTVALYGDAELGLQIARAQCRRCHRVDSDKRISGIGSTPSFAVLRSLPDWQDRFAAFYALNPHPSFTLVAEVTEPFPPDRPPPIVPVELTLDEVEAVLAYVAAMQAADLGAPLAHQ